MKVPDIGIWIFWQFCLEEEHDTVQAALKVNHLYEFC